MPTYAFEGKRPVIASSAYVSPTAVVSGDVTIGDRCYVGHGAILRGDWGTIEIGDGTAVEEQVFIHARPGDLTRIEQRVTLGHGSMVHNATVHEGAVIGMRSVISDFSEIGAYAIVGEMGLVRRHQKISPYKVAVGIPAKEIRDVDDDELARHQRAKDLYADLARRCTEGAHEDLNNPDRLRPDTDSFVPIGVIRTPFTTAVGTPIQGALSNDTEGEVVIDPAYRQGLSDLDGFSHIVLIYTFHQMDGFKLKMKPYLDKKERGIFATRSPCRPNPIGMTVVRLIESNGNRLRVSGVDMLDETPLLDIKPSIPVFDHHDSVRCGWFEPHLERIKQDGSMPVADSRFHGDDKD